MTEPKIVNKHSRREMRKTLVKLRMEMHRQELRRESRNLVNPFARMRGVTQNLQAGLGIKHAPLWGMAGVVLLGFLTGKGARKSGIGGLGRLVKLGTTMVPLFKLVMNARTRR